MKNISLSIILLLTLFLQSCIQYEPVELVSVDDATLLSISPTGAEFRIEATILNPNDYSIKIDTKDMHIFINDNELGVANFKESVKLDKGSKKQYTIDIVSSIPSDGNIDLGMIAMGGLTGNLTFKAEGNIKASAKGLSKTIPVSFKEKL